MNDDLYIDQVARLLYNISWPDDNFDRAMESPGNRDFWRNRAREAVRATREVIVQDIAEGIGPLLIPVIEEMHTLATKSGATPKWRAESLRDLLQTALGIIGIEAALEKTERTYVTEQWVIRPLSEKESN